MGMSGGMAAMGILSFSNAQKRAQGEKDMADYQAAIYNINKQFADEQGKFAKSDADIQSGEMEKQGEQNAARQRVDAAATGADVNAGSAIQLQTDTKWQAGQNSIMIKNNAWRQAWGYQVEGDAYARLASMAELTGQREAQDTLLTGGMQALGYGIRAGVGFYDYNSKSNIPSGGMFAGPDSYSDGYA